MTPFDKLITAPADTSLKAANDIIATAGKVDSVGSSLATAAVLILVYGGYFLATALACRRMARQSWTKLE